MYHIPIHGISVDFLYNNLRVCGTQSPNNTMQ